MWIVVGHLGTAMQRVDVAEHEVADVCDLFAADITPVQLALGHVPLKDVSITVAVQEIIERPMQACQPGVAPVNAFVATCVVRQAMRVMTKPFAESRHAAQRPLPRRGVIADVV